MIAGNKAYQKSDFEAAGLNYQSIIIIDPANKEAIFNLAGVELNMGNTQGIRHKRHVSSENY